MSTTILSFALCFECCECPTPTLQWDSRSASKSKVGYPELAGFVSSPPKYYKKRVETRNLTLVQEGEFLVAGTTGCPCYKDVIAWTGSGTTVVTGEYDVDGGFTGSTDNTGTKTINQHFENTEGGECELGDPFEETTPVGLIGAPPYTPSSGTAADGATDFTFASYGGASNCAGLSDPPTEQILVTAEVTGDITLSLEDTTDDLKTRTQAALPEFDDDWNDTAGSYYELTEDETTNSIRESRYRFRFQIPKVGRGTCYKITWVERFTPEEGDPVDTERCAIWDEDVPEGYDPDDSETWPVIGDGTNPYFELAIPESNGTVTVVEVEAVCQGCGEGCPA